MNLPKYKFENLELETQNRVQISTIKVTEKFIAIGFNNNEIKLYNFDGNLATGNVLKIHKPQPKSHSRQRSLLPILCIDMTPDATFLVAVTENLAAVFDLASESQFLEDGSSFILPSITAAVTGLNCCSFSPSFNNKKDLPNILIGNEKLILLSKKSSHSFMNANKLESKILDENSGVKSSSHTSSELPLRHQNPSTLPKADRSNKILAMAFNKSKKYLGYCNKYGIKIASYLAEKDELNFLGFQPKPGGHHSSTATQVPIVCEIYWKNHILICNWGDYLLLGKIEITKKYQNSSSKTSSISSLSRDLSGLQISSSHQNLKISASSSLNKSKSYTLKTRYLPLSALKLDDGLFRGLAINLSTPENFPAKNSPLKNQIQINSSRLQTLDETSNFEHSFEHFFNKTQNDLDVDQISVSSYNTVMTGMTNFSSVTNSSKNLKQTSNSSSNQAKKMMAKYPQLKMTALVHHSNLTDLYKFGVLDSKNDKNVYELHYYEVDFKNLKSNKISDFETNFDDISEQVTVKNLESENDSNSPKITLYESIEEKLFICNQGKILNLLPLTMTNQVNLLLEQEKYQAAFDLAISVATFTEKRKISSESGNSSRTRLTSRPARNNLLEYENSKKVELSVQNLAAEKYLKFLVISETSSSSQAKNLKIENSNAYFYPKIIAFIENKSKFWNLIFDKYYENGLCHLILRYLPVISDFNIFSLGLVGSGEGKENGEADQNCMAKSLTLNNDPVRLTKEQYTKICLQAVENFGVERFKEETELISETLDYLLKIIKGEFSLKKMRKMKYI